MAFRFQDIEISWYGQSAFLIRGAGRKIWIDPFQLPGNVEEGDLVLVSHDHFDHFSDEDLRKVVGPETIVISPFDFEIAEMKHQLLPVGQRLELSGVQIEAVAAYNTDKFKEPGKVFHPEGVDRCGFVLTIGGIRVYHAGDTDVIPEMREIKCDLALIPISGTYVMTKEEAVEALEEIQPKLAIPMHYGGIVGTEEDAKYVKEHASVPVEILREETV